MSSQFLYGFSRSRDGVPGQPHHTVEIEYPKHPASLLPMGVPRFVPFPGLRYSHSHIRSLDDVVCPPYDVISDSERAALAARSPSNIVRVELPSDDGDSVIGRYERARQLLDAWRDGGILHRTGSPLCTATA